MAMEWLKINKEKLLLQFKGQDRSSLVKKNALLSLIFRGLSVLISLLLVPLCIHFVGKEQYGIWLTISSIVAWMSLFDIGLSNGLRNKLVRCLALNDVKSAKTYVSTVYISLGIIFFVVWLFFLCFNPIIDWVKVLNIPFCTNESMQKLIFIVFSYFCISLVLKTANSILLADQKAAYTSIMDLGGQLFALLLIFLMNRYVAGSLLYLTLAMCIMPILVAFFFNGFLFRFRYKEIAPSIKYFDFACVKDLIGISFRFFVIQIAAIIQYQTANIIIARYFNMAEVTNYNIVYKYFSLIYTVFIIIISPLWSAATDAYIKKEYNWIRNSVKKYTILLLIMSCVGVVMLVISATIYNLWIGKDAATITFALSFWCLIFIIISMFGSIFVNILNGIGAIKIQFFSSLITPILYIFLCYFLIDQLKMGIYSVFIAAILSNVNAFIIAPMQYVKVFIQNKRGIWAA